MKDRGISFLLGLILGYKGIGLVTHLVYLSLIVAAYFAGKLS